MSDIDECCSVCFRRVGINAGDDGTPPVDLGRCAAPGGFECRAVGQAVAGYRRENEVLRSNSDHLSSENASLVSQVDSMAMRIESLTEELAKPEDVRLREVLDALDGRAVIFDGLGARVGHLLDEMDEWIERAGESERAVETARRRLACVAESMTEHAYQELASALEARPHADGTQPTDDASELARLRKLFDKDMRRVRAELREFARRPGHRPLMTTPTTTVHQLAQLHPDLPLSIADAMALTGYSERTIQRRIASGALPAFTVGPRGVRVRAGDLAALFQPRPAMPGAPTHLTRTRRSPKTCARGLGTRTNS